MGRSVVRAGGVRCPGCSLPPRWCICDAVAPVDTPLGVHVFIHRHEHVKPSSTGRLVARVVSGATARIYQRQSRFFPAVGFPPEALAADRELWILHPDGGPWPGAEAGGPNAAPSPRPTGDHRRAAADAPVPPRATGTRQVCAATALSPRQSGE